MNFKMQRIFCGAPDGLEDERRAFHEVIAEVNERTMASNGVLFVPVSLLPNMVNTLLFKSAVESNIAACSYFVQILDNTWGPPTKNFEWKYELACRLKDDPGSPLQEVAVFFKESSDQDLADSFHEFKNSLVDIGAPCHCFEDISAFREKLRSRLLAWHSGMVSQTV